MSAIPTVRVKSDAPGHQPDGFFVMNESDFDPVVHELFDVPAAATEAKTESKPGKGKKE